MRNPLRLHRLGAIPQAVAALALVALCPLQPAFTEEVAPPFALRTVDREEAAVEVASIDERGISTRPVAAGNGSTAPEPRLAAWNDLVHLERRAAKARATKTDDFLLYLAGGERLVGRPSFERMKGERFHFAVAESGPVEMPADALASLVRRPAVGPSRSEWHERATDADVAYDVTDDRLEGTLLEFNPTGVSFEADGGRTRVLAWERLHTLHLAAIGRAEDALQKGATVEIEGASGSRWLADAPPKLVAGSLLFRTRSLPKVDLTIAWSDVAALRTRGGISVSATRLAFTGNVETPLSDHGDKEAADILRHLWRVRVDERAEGRPLSIAGRTYRHGFAVYGATRVVVPLGGRFAKFHVAVGIDDETLEATPDVGELVVPRGDAGARVLGDGKELWRSASVRGGEAAQIAGPLDVTGVQELVLETDLGPDQRNVLDRVNWVEPLLVPAR